MWKDKPLIAHVQAIVRPFTDDLIISCNRNAARYRAYADQLVEDPQKDFPGPWPVFWPDLPLRTIPGCWCLPVMLRISMPH